MIRFLKSINIENFDDFDIDFEMIGRNRFKNEQWDMVICKSTPWNYRFLKEFQDGLQLIKYPYSIKFSYLRRPDFEDVLSLFDEWYQSIYRLPHNLVIKGNEQSDFLMVEYTSESEKEQYSSIIVDFKDFLTFICYDFVIRESVVIKEETDEPQEEIPSVDKYEEPMDEEDDISVLDLPAPEIPDEIPPEALAEFSNSNENEEEDNFDPIDSSYAAERKKELDTLVGEVEESLLEVAKKNEEQMKKDRERARLNKRGGYKVVNLIDSIDSNSGSVDFVAYTFFLEIKEFGGKKRFNLGVADKNMGAIYVNMYQNASISDASLDEFGKWGTKVRVRGVAYVDDFTKSLTIKGHFIDILPPDEIEPDNEPVKRVELHLHTKMSAQDGVSSMNDYCKLAKAYGHTAIALTDHAIVQAYPDAQKAGKENNIKVLYGCELYVVDDELHYIKNPADIPLNNAKYVVLDLETTGLSSKYNRIMEFGAVRVENGMQVSSLDLLINPEVSIPKKIVNLTGITDDMVKDKPTIKECIQQIIDYIGDAIIVTHNADFDFAFLQETLKRLGMPLLTNPVIDTLSIAWYLYPDAKKHTLGSLCKRMEINYDEDDAHRADYDAKVLNDVWQPIIVVLTKDNKNLTHADLGKLMVSDEIIKHKRATHATVLVKNLAGLKDLYKLVSFSHTDYLADVPRVPKKMLQQYRSNLLIGSACFNGEVFRTAQYYGEEDLMKAMEFYDYIEIQPKSNYSFLVNMGDISDFELDQYLKDIVKYADQIGKKVVATGDVHYSTQDKKIFRDVYIDAPGLKNAVHPLNPYARKKLAPFENPDQHYRNTREMLDEMAFLGEEKAYEIVVKNTNEIADQIESILPVPNDKLYTPTIDNCENMLKEMCYNKAHELYGDPLPELIQKRLDTELAGIINAGYAVIYYIAHRLVKKANDDGYIVGSRGSVGSSFVATMSGITEVNALPPHYRCPKCKHLEWTSETMPEYKSGYDLPEKKCPVCGELMAHDGQNIPFETFLGFKADKVPDIDLNFPGDYQAKAHDYTKVLLGENNVFRAGTIETVADKTAFGFARGFLERKGVNLATYPKAKIAFLASGCIDVKRTTGQHPGGIVVVPDDHDVFDFTPYQYPADEAEATWKTTHFDFHSIHDTILKLDLLGHVDPVALRMMCQLTNIDIKDIPLNDPKVYSLFYSPDALKMESDYTNAETGALAIPEFGTEFVRGILEDTRPKSFSDLVIISGLSHGTGVWNGNADKLIENGVATLQEVIGCRDDIMTYLIDKGIEPSVSFKIMEDVRKGRGLKPEYEEIMRNNKVPDYYINSCKLIKYMFPKGHAVAYVTMAIRVGYFKIYHPLEFYATFFSVRSKQYDIETMIAGKDAIIAKLEELKTKSKREKLSPKESEQIKTLNIALEMTQRGYKFENINLYKSDSVNFVVDHENNALIPPFAAVDNLGANNAETVIEERKKGEFFSKEDLLRRTKLTSTNVKALTDMGVLDFLNDTDQLSLFDF